MAPPAEEEKRNRHECHQSDPANAGVRSHLRCLLARVGDPRKEVPGHGLANILTRPAASGSPQCFRGCWSHPQPLPVLPARRPLPLSRSTVAEVTSATPLPAQRSHGHHRRILADCILLAAEPALAAVLHHALLTLRAQVQVFGARAACAHECRHEPPAPPGLPVCALRSWDRKKVVYPTKESITGLVGR